MATQDDDPFLLQAEGLLVATADHGDAALDDNVRQVLEALRRTMRMDVVFVSKFEDGQRTFKVVADGGDPPTLRAGDADPIEQSWCQHVVSGRLPQFMKDSKPLRTAGVAPATPLDIGTHLSVPVLLRGGRVYGTLCTFSFHVDDEVSLHDVWRLRAVADLIARRIEPPE